MSTVGRLHELYECPRCRQNVPEANRLVHDIFGCPQAGLARLRETVRDTVRPSPQPPPKDSVEGVLDFMDPHGFRGAA